MAKRKFKAESKRLLELMINSIYTHREIFLRELISNASDAIDKIYYKALTDDSLSFDKESYYIKIAVDKETRTLQISDTGIGMTKEELEENLGVIAKSGSFAFKNERKSLPHSLSLTAVSEPDPIYPYVPSVILTSLP
jgi:molecular chaperone HtpG